MRLFNIIKYMRGEHDINISVEKYVRILMLSRLANGDELLPTYEPSEEEIDELCSSVMFIEKYGKVNKHNTARSIMN